MTSDLQLFQNSTYLSSKIQNLKLKYQPWTVLLQWSLGVLDLGATGKLNSKLIKIKIKDHGDMVFITVYKHNHLAQDESTQVRTEDLLCKCAPNSNVRQMR